MRSYLIESGAIAELRACIAGVTSYDFAVYDARGRLLLPSLSGDPIVESFASSDKGKEEQENFFLHAVQTAAHRKGPSLLKGPMNQHHAFIPVTTEDDGMVLAGNAFYASIKDLEDFLSSKGGCYRLSIKDMAHWRRKITPADPAQVSAVCEHAHRLLGLIAGNMREKTVYRERSLKTSAALELFSGIDKGMSKEQLYSVLCDAMIFLFNGDTASVMVRVDDHYLPALTAGNRKTEVGQVPLRHDASMISSAIDGSMAGICNESAALVRLGYPEQVTSLYLFPLATSGEQLGLLGVFNSPLSEDDCGIITKICGFAAFLLRTIHSQKVLDSHISTLTSLNHALNTQQAFQDPDTVYDSIVEVSSRLMDAEKASLMLPEAENQELLIGAVRGINKQIARSIRVRIGEGVAGKVYRDGEPLVVRDIETSLSCAKKPSYKTRSFVSIPLKIGDEAIGVLNLADKISGEVFSEEDMTFLRYFASYASIAIKSSQFYRQTEELKTLSITDPLTRSYNRRYFNDRLAEELERGSRYDYVFSLAIFDLDDFKLFNDSEGHLAGDEALRTVADIAKESLRSIDIVSRFGGEEFSVIMPQTDRKEAYQVMERLRKNIRDLMPAKWKLFPRERITVSAGLASFPADGRDANTLIRNVDRALYRAKLTGKDKTVVWEAFNPPPVLP
ncbi:MAG: sensor domain-containing diguanylate cyclase [Nitrospirae bacterium]|nr:sensor domain-containing diguanylate cyclase [Nitrospirota bacterium]